MILREFCAENFTDVPEAIAAGARRIELCDNLAVGGTTPSFGVLRATRRYAHDRDVAVFVMIRPRGGDFVYTELELQMMLSDIDLALAQGVDGLVMGALTSDDEIDQTSMRRLLSAAGDTPVTFHMAFDEIDPARRPGALDTLADLGVARLLTHGGAPGTDIIDNLDVLRGVVDHVRGRFRVVAGGGVTIDNYQEVIAATGVNEVHGTRIYRR